MSHLQVRALLGPLFASACGVALLGGPGDRVTKIIHTFQTFISGLYYIVWKILHIIWFDER